MARKKIAKRKLAKKSASPAGERSEGAGWNNTDDTRDFGHGLAQKIVATVREAMLVLDNDLRVTAANDSFYDKFQVRPEETEGRLVYELGNNQWDIPELRRLLEDILPANSVFNDYELDHVFETLGRRVMRLNARRIDHIERILLAIEDITEHRLAEGRRAFLLELMECFWNCEDSSGLLQQASMLLCKFLGSQRAMHAEVEVDENRVAIVVQHCEAGGAGGTLQQLSDFAPEVLASLLEHRELIITDVRTDPRCGQQSYRDAFERLGVRALLCVARKMSPKRFALVTVSFATPHPWREEEIALVRDVAERTWAAQESIRAEEALRESEERLRRAAEATGFGTYDYDVSTGRSIWSPELYALMGVGGSIEPHEQFLVDRVHAGDRASFQRGKQAALDPSGPGRHEMEFRIVCPDSGTRWVRDTGQTFFTDAGNLRHAVRVVGTVQDITQRKQAEEALRDSEQRFRAMADDLPLMVWLHSVEGRQTFVNKTFCEYTGLSREQMRDDYWQKLVHPENAAYASEFIACVRERRTFHAQARIRRADGQWRWVESWGQPRFGSEGQYLGHIGGSADITERKQAELERDTLNATLEQQVEQRTELFKLLQDVTRSSNEAGNVEEALLAILARIAQHHDWQVGHVWWLSGDDSGELVSSGLWYETDQARQTIKLDRFKQVCAEMRLSSGECMVGTVMESLASKWIDSIRDFDDWTRGEDEDFGLHAAVAFPITIEDGRVVAVMEFFSDRPIHREARFMEIMPDVGIQLGHVFKRHQAERSLHVSEERRRAVLNAAPDAIISMDSHGVITDANPASERIFGYREEELVGRNVSMLMPSPYREEHDAYLARYLKTRHAKIIGIGREIVGQRKDGRVVPIRININEIDHLGLFVGIVHDISLEKELEKQVVDASAEEQRRIAGDIHDGVGQELTGLRYMAQTHAETLAAQSSAETKTARRMVEWLETVQRQLRHIIRELVPVEIDKHGLVAALRGLAERTSQVHDVACAFECDQTIAVSDAALATHVFRIAQEAARNAVKHGQASQIRIQLMEENDALRLQVDDDGVGIDASPDKTTGFGLRSMAYRAGLIGANFTCRQREEGGTQVTCAVLRGGEVNIGEWRMPETDDMKGWTQTEKQKHDG